MGIALPPHASALFETYYRLLEKRGQDVNLTSITGAEDVARLHFLDSLALLGAAGFRNARLLDVGSGAGFPGIPLKIAEPTIDLTLLDSTGKRISFLTELTATLGIEAACIHARAEEAAHDPQHRGKYDIVVSRAVARLNALCELCLPFASAEGLFIAMKSAYSDEEATQAQSALEALGARLEALHDYEIPGAEITRRAIIIRKTSPTPDKYPRRPARIKSSPL